MTWKQDYMLEYNKRYREENKQRADEYAREYREKNREILNAKRKVHYRNNRESILAGDRARYEKNREKRARQHREWQIRNRESVLADNARRRAMKLGATIVPISKASLGNKWEYWAGKCWMCGENAASWDHVKPLNKGGAHALCNLRPACKKCNSGKRDRWPLSVKLA